MVGIFDLPAPLFAWVDRLMGGIVSPTLRLVLWGLLASVLSMGLYWLLSPQGRLSEVKTRAVKARLDLNAFDGDFAEAWPLMRTMLALSLRQLGMTTWPALVASIPVLALIVWLGTAYGYRLPADGGEVGVQAMPLDLVSVELQPPGDAAAQSYPRLVVTDQGGRVLSDISLTVPVPVIHKKRWWNMLFGNPLGYLPDDGVVEAIEVDLPERDYLGVGPDWLRPWYVLFFATLLLGSLAIKILGRIE